MVKEYYTLDGKECGIMAEILNGSPRKTYVTIKDRVTPRLFTNLDLAKVICKTIIPDREFKFYLNIKGDIIPIDRCRTVGHTYQYFTEDNILRIIKEIREHKALNLGYICFENGDTERCDSDYGHKRQYELMSFIREICTQILFQNNDIRIDRIQNKNKEIIIHIKGTTAKIHILHNSRLMDLNQARIAENKRVLHFIKQMDKYTTFYVYSTKDSREGLKIEGENKSITIMNQILVALDEAHKELNVNYVPVEYNGYIELEE